MIAGAMRHVARFNLVAQVFFALLSRAFFIDRETSA